MYMDPVRPLTIAEIVRLALPWFGVTREVAVWRLRNLPNFWRGFWRLCVTRALGVPHMQGQVRIRVFREGEVVDLGLASLRVITTAGVTFLINSWIAAGSMNTVRYHGFGSGAAAESVADTALGAEFTTQYEETNVRPVGTLSAVGLMVRSIATMSPSTSVAITEHGLFNNTSSGSGVLWDRSVFSVVNIAGGGGNSIELTYECTFTAGG